MAGEKPRFGRESVTCKYHFISGLWWLLPCTVDAKSFSLPAVTAVVSAHPISFLARMHVPEYYLLLIATFWKQVSCFRVDVP